MTRIEWDADALTELDRVPFLVRSMVRGKIEKRVRDGGGRRVTGADFREAESRFRAVIGGKSGDEIQKMLPQPNRPGAEMVLIETCHAELSECPNVLVRTSPWRDALEKWVREKDISERLRKRITEDRILHHRKLRVSLSGCPNACSRPQIADIGLVGYVTPRSNDKSCDECMACAEACRDAAIAVTDNAPHFDLQACQGCLRCREACPNECIELSRPGMRLLAGGKLGRHPHLADVVAEFMEPEAAIERINKIVDSFIQNAPPDERFADYWIRTTRADSGGRTTRDP